MYTPVDMRYKGKCQIGQKEPFRTEFVRVIATCVACHEKTGKAACGNG